VYNQFCGSFYQFYTNTISTGSASLNLGTIKVTIPNNTTTITGTVVDCNSKPLGNSIVYLESPFNTFINPNASTGIFSYSFNCTNINPALGITAFDLGNNVSGYQSTSITIGSNNNIGNIVACGTANPFFNVIIKNNTTSTSDTIIRNAPGEVSCGIGTNGFAYPWALIVGPSFFFFTSTDTSVGTFNIPYQYLYNYPNSKDSFDFDPAGTAKVTFTSFPPVGNVTGSFSMDLIGYPSLNSYKATGTFRAPRKF
jgi:hypothetical protein